MAQNGEGDMAQVNANVGKVDNNVLAKIKQLKELDLSPQSKFIINDLHVDDDTPFMNSLYSYLHFILDETRSTSMWKPSLPNGSLKMRLLASNDGFLCFHVSCYPQSAMIYVYNPTTPSICNILSLPTTGIRPSSDDLLLGIAFDRKVDACKIVLVISDGKCNPKKMTSHIYNAKDATWRSIDEDLAGFFTPCRKEAFVFQGLFCWLGWLESGDTKKEIVIVFDVENEKWKEPIFLDKKCFSFPLCLVELENELCVVTKPEKWKLKVWKVYTDERPHDWLKDVDLWFCEDENLEYVFGGKGVLYIGVRRGLWLLKIMGTTSRNFLVAVHSLWKINTSPFRMRQCSVFKPSLLKFQGDGHLPGNEFPGEHLATLLLDL